LTPMYLTESSALALRKPRRTGGAPGIPQQKQQ
jgi:hypothetical protein